MPAKREGEGQDFTIPARALEAISFECECGCRVEIPWSGELEKERVKALAKAVVCPCCGAAIPGAPKAWKAFEALAWSTGGDDDKVRLRFRLRLLRQVPR